MTGHGEAERTGPQDHMEASLVHRLTPPLLPTRAGRPFAGPGD